MDVRELTREQLVELKSKYMVELVNENRFAEVMRCDHDEPSYCDYANADNLVSDEFIFEHYADIDFKKDDFFCTANI